MHAATPEREGGILTDGTSSSSWRCRCRIARGGAHWHMLLAGNACVNAAPVGGAASAGGVEDAAANHSEPVDDAHDPVTFITFRNAVMQNIALLFESMKPGKIYDCRVFQRLKQLHEKNTGSTFTNQEFLPCFASATLCHNRQFVQEVANKYLPSDQVVQELHRDETLLRLVRPPTAAQADNVQIAGVMRPAVFFENIPQSLHSEPKTLRYSNTGVSVKMIDLKEIFLGEQNVAELHLLCLLTQSACKSAFLYTKDTFLPCLDWVDTAVDIAVFWVLYALRTRTGDMSSERVCVTGNCFWADDNEKRQSLQPQQLPEPFHEAIILMRQKSRLYSKHVRQVTRTLHVNGIHNSLMRGVYPLPVIKHCIKYTCNCALADKPMEEKCEIAKATSREQLFDSERTLAAPANFKCLCAFWLGADDLQIQCADLTNYQQPCMLLPCQSLSSANNNDDNNDPTMWVHEALNNNHLNTPTFLDSYMDKCPCMKCDTASVFERVRDIYTAQGTLDLVAPAIFNIASALAQHEMHVCTEQESAELVRKMLLHCNFTDEDRNFLDQLWCHQFTEIAGIAQQNVHSDVDLSLSAAEDEVFELFICRAMFKLLRFYQARVLLGPEEFTKVIHSCTMQLACGNMFMLTMFLKAGMQCVDIEHLGPTDFGDMNVFTAAASITRQPKPKLESNTLDLDEYCLLQCYTSKKIVEVVLRSPMGIRQVCDGIILYVKSMHEK